MEDSSHKVENVFSLKLITIDSLKNNNNVMVYKNLY